MLVGNRIASIPSELSFPELFLSLPRILTARKEGRTMASYYSKIIGKRNFERVFGPLFSAVICQKADEFPADLLFKKRPRRKDVLRNFTVREGLQSITDSLAARPGITVLTGRGVREITSSDGVFSVATDSRICGGGALAGVIPRSLRSPVPDQGSRLRSGRDRGKERSRVPETAGRDHRGE